MADEKIKTTSDHLANERTFLAWVRTSVGIMAFGFVVVKFSLFIKQVSVIVEKESRIVGHGYSAISGIILVGIGALITLLAFIRYKRVQKQIEKGSFDSSTPLLSFLTVIILLMSVLLIGYLMGNI